MWDWRVRSGPLEVGGKAVEEEPETGHLVLFGYSQGKAVASRGEEPEAPRGWGEASVRGWAARVSLCCRPGLCCCAQAEVWGARWPGAPVEVAAGPRSCASCQYCWWRWAERGLAARVSASGEALGWRCGCSLYHLEGARWLLTREVGGQQLENWGSARLAYQPGSLQTHHTALDQQSLSFSGSPHPPGPLQPAHGGVAFPLVSGSAPLTETTDRTDPPLGAGA